MPVLTRYEINCEVLPDKRAPFTSNITYYTNAPFSRNAVHYNETFECNDVLGEFWNHARATRFSCWMNFIYRVEAIQKETSNVASIKNDPTEIFVAKEDITKTFEVPESATQVMIYVADVYIWEGEKLLAVEGRLPTTRPRSLVQTIYIDPRPFAEQEKDQRRLPKRTRLKRK
ncbi:MAG: hypothetical protein AABX14_05200 [Candidatus Aenigmatarchaeota archaeon]